MKIKKKKPLFLALTFFILGFIFGQAAPLVSNPEPLSLPQTKLQTAKVTRVIDGDTVELETGQHVRYIGMDTPETVDPRKTVECFGLEASKKNKELVQGKTVLLEKDVTDKDQYGRLLRYVWVGNTLVNLELVKEGFAHSYTYPPDVKYQTEILAAEKEARETNQGLWQACR